ncbi:hypothetical protein [Nocardia sp. NPDC004860]|uniref:hypothetical protein n=1 Tax=Nocardia sp. NPDC004860 TaxID=3154557 RepID=UPI0033A19B92
MRQPAIPVGTDMTVTPAMAPPAAPMAQPAAPPMRVPIRVPIEVARPNWSTAAEKAASWSAWLATVFSTGAGTAGAGTVAAGVYAVIFLIGEPPKFLVDDFE